VITFLLQVGQVGEAFRNAISRERICSHHLWSFLSLKIQRYIIIFHYFILFSTPFGKRKWTPRIPRHFSGLESYDKRQSTELLITHVMNLRKCVDFPMENAVFMSASTYSGPQPPSWCAVSGCTRVCICLLSMCS
jgi:hypothetical protein